MYASRKHLVKRKSRSLVSFHALKWFCVLFLVEMTNYDIPKSAASSNYDIPRSSASEGTYDVPKSYEDLTENNDEYDDIQDVPRDVPV